MSDPDRNVAGIRCREVLASLSDYLDGSLDEERVRQIRQHLEGCDWCERFGGQFARAIAALRRSLRTAGPLSESVRQRLRRRLADETTG